MFFCDYTDDNSSLEDEIKKLNFDVLTNIKGKYKVLEVINSGSCFELPKDTLKRIKDIIIDKNIERLFLESHWCYRNRLQEMRDYFNVPITFKKTGVETFDNEFRNNYLNKNAKFHSYKEVSEYFDSPCLMVGIKGQTKEMIDRDIEIALTNFNHATINVFVIIQQILKEMMS